jgi:hypothetical protein
MTQPRIIATIAHRPASTLGLVAIFAAFALGLTFQQPRWYSTPAYGNLLTIMTAAHWGIVYGCLSVLLFCAVLLPRYRWLSLGAHTLVFILLASWEAGFFVRWVTDPKTTVANVLAWLAYLALCARSASLIDMVAEQAEIVSE